MLAMYYYKVYVGSPRFHGDDALTYRHDQLLPVGCPVIVPLQKTSAVGFVAESTPKPRFTTKPIIRALPDRPLPPESLPLFNWIRSYYPAPLGVIAQLFVPSMLLQKSQAQPETAGTSTSTTVTLPPLTDEQSQAVAAIQASNNQSYLLHGDTGTGKTRLYLELITKTISQDKSVLLLTPEIGLTPQLIASCQQVFPAQTMLIHSNLTAAQRRNAWLRIAGSKTPLIIIGPRSALFSPAHRIGLIILDEAHEAAYKQEQAPHYTTSRVAAKLASLHKAKLILGTATPPVSDYYAFSAKHLPIIRLQKLATNTLHSVPSISIVNLRERDQFNDSPWLSKPLLQAIKDSLRNKTQTLLFLNRRGTARLVLCQNCGWQATCPKCDLPLTYHADFHSLRCHTCGFASSTPASCPKCQSTDILFKSIGTKTIAQEINRLFPKAKVQRFDSDNIKSERLEELYEQLKSNKIDIIIGTQMLAKGLDLPSLSVVGVVIADTSLYFPDYTAEERTYQLLTQVIGRVGRGHQAATVVIQTYNPTNPTIQDSVSKNYNDFYARQLAEREQFLFPPFCHVLKLSISRASRTNAQKAADTLKTTLSQSNQPVEIQGPAPAFNEKAGGKYKWQLIIKAKQRGALTAIIKDLPSGWNYDIDPIDLL